MIYTAPWEPGFDTSKILAKHMAVWLDLVNVDPLIEEEGPNFQEVPVRRRQHQRNASRPDDNIVNNNMFNNLSTEDAAETEVNGKEINLNANPEGVPDLNEAPDSSAKDKQVALNLQEKQARKERKKQKKLEARMRRNARSTPPDQTTQAANEQGTCTSEEESSDEDNTTPRGMWATEISKKPRGTKDIMETTGGWHQVTTDPGISNMSHI
ncbi:hypothetical protein R1sor_020630 [Riccia sorocarpa]|uniref:Uncharacterized protein n=1 Tax=Riccia sorocarpa TaxID=122646 RepID=A0ABD3GKF4_9MARC